MPMFPFSPRARCPRCGRLRRLSVTPVAVGTDIAGRPPHGPYERDYRIRLLSRMHSVKAHVGIGMQDTGSRDPSLEVRAQAIPAGPSLLAAAAQSLPPQSAETVAESSQHRAVARYGVIRVVAFHDPFQPCAYGAHRRMQVPA